MLFLALAAANVGQILHPHKLFRLFFLVPVLFHPRYYAFQHIEQAIDTILTEKVFKMCALSEKK